MINALKYTYLLIDEYRNFHKNLIMVWELNEMISYSIFLDITRYFLIKKGYANDYVSAAYFMDFLESNNIVISQEHSLMVTLND